MKFRKKHILFYFHFFLLSFHYFLSYSPLKAPLFKMFCPLRSVRHNVTAQVNLPSVPNQHVFKTREAGK